MQHPAEKASIKIDSTPYFVVFYKPAGLRLKKISVKQLGLLDVLEKKLREKLHLVYEMADSSSGLLLLAKTAEVAQKLKHEIKNNSQLYISELKFKFEDQDYHYKLNEPYKTENKNLELTDLLHEAWFSLNQIYQVNPSDCYRLIHNLNSEIQVDIYGEVLWVYWYRDLAPTEAQQKEISDFAHFIHKKSCLRHMVNRGYGVGGKETEKLFSQPETPLEWIAQENNPPYRAQYKLKQNAGFSPGLFLDQRENRTWVFQNSTQKKVLNLFSYTSGFSVAAALGQALQVTTVDASSSFLEWSKENFILNDLKPEAHEFFSQDTQLFLGGSLKRNRKWDLIICDPPSFGRTKTTVWKIEKDLTELATAMWKCLAVKGTILFTCNYEKWNLDDVIKNFTSKLKKDSYILENLPAPGFDFELPDHYNNLTKGFLLHKLKN